VATHIPTGRKLTPHTSYNKTKGRALSEAKREIAKFDDFQATIVKVMESPKYKEFAKLRYEQTKTEVF